FCSLTPSHVVYTVSSTLENTMDGPLSLIYNHSSREKTSDALVPPKPKLLDKATLTFFCCAWCGTKLNRDPTSGLFRFSVGGTTFSRLVSKETNNSTMAAHTHTSAMARIENTASMAPAAP